MAAQHPEHAGGAVVDDVSHSAEPVNTGGIPHLKNERVMQSAARHIEALLTRS